MYKRKSIVLSDAKQQSNKKAVLSLQEDSSGVFGSLRLYNFSEELSGVSSLGFYINQKIYKAGLTKKARMLYEFFLDISDIPEKFSCAVINFQNAVASPILYGTSEGKDDNAYASIISQISSDMSYSNVKNTLDDYGIDFDEDEKKVVDKEIDNAMCDQNCNDCIYKKFFYENQTAVAQAQEKDEPVEVRPEETEPIFIDKLKPQIDKLFEQNPVESSLQDLIPNSKWVKIEYDDEGDFYVFGLLYDELEEVKYVCYGVPAIFEEEPPKELSGYPIWLPLNKENYQGFGYWLTYQDATTGEPVKAILD